MIYERYAQALEALYQEQGTLDGIVSRLACLGVSRPFSKATWGRILNGAEMRYEHAQQIAQALELEQPEAPPQVEAQAVEEWRKVGRGTPKLGLLVALDCAVITVKEIAPGSTAGCSVRHRTASRSDLGPWVGVIYQDATRAPKNGRYGVNMQAVISALERAQLALCEQEETA